MDQAQINAALERWQADAATVMAAFPATRATFGPRSHQAVAFSLPYLTETLGDLRDKTVLEVGCGSGAKSLALAPHTGRYIGIDIDAEAIAQAQASATLINSRAEFVTMNADAVAGVVAQAQPDVIVLYAILEHLTPDERAALFTALWEGLPDHGAIYIGEAPNRLNMIDFHSSQLPYFSMIPPWLAEQTYRHSKRREWIDRVEQEDSVWLGLHRRGQPFSVHDLLPTFGSFSAMNRHVVADNFSLHKLNWKGWKLSNSHFLEQFAYLRDAGYDWYNYTLHPTFAISMVNLILSRQPTHPEGAVPLVTFEPPRRGRGAWRDWLGNRVIDLKREWRITPDAVHTEAFLGVQKGYVNTGLETFDSASQTWQPLPVPAYSDSYLATCGDHVFLPLPAAESYRIRSGQPCRCIGLLCVQPGADPAAPG